MTRDRKTVRPSHRARRRLIALMLLSVGGVITGRAVYNHYTSPERIRRIAVAFLERHTHGQVAIERASFSWLGGVRLFNVSVRDMHTPNGGPPIGMSIAGPGDAPSPRLTEPPRRADVARSSKPPSERAGLFTCRRVDVQHSPWWMLLGRFRVIAATAYEPTCTIVRNMRDGSTNLNGLLRVAAPQAGGAALRLPIIELRDARVSVVRRDETGDHAAENLELTIRGRPAPGSASLYDVVWQTPGGAGGSGQTQIDLSAGALRNIHGGLPAMQIDAVMIVVAAGYDAVGGWCDLLGLGGKVRARDYALGTPGEPRSATIDLTDATISIPIDALEQPLSADERYLRFDRVNGTIEVTELGLDADFTGMLHGSRCRVEASVRGGRGPIRTLDDVAFSAALSIDRLELPPGDATAAPAAGRFIQRFPKLARALRDYEPRGPLDLEMQVHKGRGAEERVIVTRASLTPRGTAMRCRYFPYRLTDLAGSIDYADGRLSIRELTGRHGPGTATINGTAVGLTKTGSLDLHVTGKNIAVDGDLRATLKVGHQTVWDRFHPTGTIDIDATYTRPASDTDQAAPHRVDTVVTLTGVAATYAGFAYPVEQLEGTLVIGPERVQAVDIRGRHGSTAVRLHGSVDVCAGRVAGTDLRIDAAGVPFDDTLWHALPASVRDQVTAFRPQGRFDAAAVLSIDPDTHAFGYSADVVLRDVTVTPAAFPLGITGCTGTLRVSPDRVVVQGVDARCRDAAVNVRGAWRWVSPARQPTAAPGPADSQRTQTVPAPARPAADADGPERLTVTFRDLRVDDDVRAALPNAVREALGPWRIDGPVDAEIAWHAEPTGPDHDRPFHAAVKLDGVTVRYGDTGLPLEDVRGTITADARSLRASGVTARVDDAELTIDVAIDRSRGADDCTISLTADDVRLDGPVREMLPAALRRAWDRLDPTGRVSVRIDRLEGTRPRADAPRRWSLEGTIGMRDVALPGVGDVRHMSGVVTGGGWLVDRLGGAMLSGRLDLAALDVHARRIHDATGTWSFDRAADGGGMLRIGDVQGSLYDGLLGGKVEVEFDADTTTYSLAATAQGVDLVPLLDAGAPPERADHAPVATEGRVDARLYLSGRVGDRSARRGEGGVRIYDAAMYRLPIMIAILNAVDLSTPLGQRTFTGAQADGFIVGDRLELSRILLEGGALTLGGAGTMTLADQRVDLHLINVGQPHWANIPILTDVLQGASRELIELHVTGPLSKPTVRAGSLRSVERLQKLFVRRRNHPK